LPKTNGFGTENAQKRHLKRRNAPSYRVICSYSKGTRQYWRERTRRQQVLKLTQEGKNTREIAEALGVSSRTVLRDMLKLHSYVIGEINRKRHLLDQQRQQEFAAAVATLSIEERFKLLTNLLCWTRKLSKKEEYDQHNMVFFVDMDHLTPAGLPSFKIDKPSSTFKMPLTIHLIAVKDRKAQTLGGITIG
jgi:DNA-binding CsgD family transcriptional regulator